ncbi:MAG: PQQ-dependent sugar dehydrogenase [Maioricimonas sp. JB049]
MRTPAAAALRPTILVIVGLLVILPAEFTLAAAERREPWTTSRIVGTPEPPAPYTVERVFEGLEFDRPVDMAVEPGTGRLLVLQLDGKLLAFSPEQKSPAPVLLHDAHATIEHHSRSYGLTFHPQYETNRQLFLCYVLPGTTANGTRVSRFRMTEGPQPVLDPESEEILITWPSGGHNGGSLKFGPDGYLYISSGDGVGPFPPDSEETGQDIGDLRATIMRIDVDHPTDDQPYSVPADNPFVDRPGARPEVWAYGFRNPWKISFNPANGELWCGDVGWELWELVYLVKKAGNYGWSVMEGRQPVRADVKRGPTPIQPPIVDHPHTEARSITGGCVYRDDRLEDLHGAYIYGDYVTGKIWALWNDGDTVIRHEEIADTSLAIITFGEDRDGNLFVVDYAGGIYRLVPNPQPDSATPFPRTLSESGLFASTVDHKPAAGVIPYSVNAGLWRDGAIAERFVALPGTTSIAWNPNHERWGFPEGTVFVRTVSLEEAPGAPATQRRIETQLLHFDGLEWRAYTYVWNDEQTDATLAPAEGFDTTVDVAGETKSWRIHSRTECLTCHMPRAGFAVGFNTENLNRLHGSAGTATSQLDRLTALNVFDRTIPDRHRQATMVDPHDDSAPLEPRVRSWLHVNCAHCHRRGGGGTAHIELPFTHPLEKTNAIDERPTQGTFGIANARIIAPGDPERSVLYYRLATVGRGHMPYLGSRNVDGQGLLLVRDWIERLGDSSPPEETPTTVPATIESVGQALQLVRAIDEGKLASEQRDRLIATGASVEQPEIRGLFERFLPEDRRVRTLGASADPAAILQLSGDASRGEKLFVTAAGLQCRNCHRVGETGKMVGPDLTRIGGQRSRRELLESILAPSRRIDPKFVTYAVQTDAGRVHSGLVIDETESSVTLREASGKDVVLQREEIDDMIAQPKSLMPELLVRDMTARDVADLLAYLESLR